MLALVAALVLQAAPPAPPWAKERLLTGELLLRFPAVDLPFNTVGFPSLQQSKHFSVNLQQASHHLIFRFAGGIHDGFWGRLGAFLTVAALDGFVFSWVQI